MILQSHKTQLLRLLAYILGSHSGLSLVAYCTSVMDYNWNVVAAFVRGLDVDHRAQIAHAWFARPPLASRKFPFLSFLAMPARSAFLLALLKIFHHDI